MDLNQDDVAKGQLIVRLLPFHVDGNYESQKPKKPIRILENTNEWIHQPSTTKVSSTKTSNESSTCPDNTNTTTEMVEEDVAIIRFDAILLENNNNNKSFLMNRTPNEPAETMLRRLALTVLKKWYKTTPYKSGEKQFQPQLKYTLLEEKTNDGSVLLQEIKHANQTSQQVWDCHTQLRLQLFESERLLLEFENIVVNPPTIASVQTFGNFKDSRIYEGVPLVVQVETLNCADLRIAIDWYVNKIRVESYTKRIHQKKENVHASCFVPVVSHIGQEVSIVITIVATGDESLIQEVYRFPHVIETRPRNAILDIRSNFLRPCHDDCRKQFRVLSYNVLADLNMQTPAAAKRMYPYCNYDFIQRERRFPLLVHEIISYRADIVCLQEVDLRIFRDLFQPVLEGCYNYQGFYACKKGSKEGCAIFWSLDAFEYCHDYQYHYIQDFFLDNDNVQDDWSSCWKDVNGLLNTHAHMKELLCDRLGHVLLSATLTTKAATNANKKKIIVANTHLFFHPKASHLRLLQLYSCLHQIAKQRAQTGDTAIVLCGDLNSSPASGAARLIWDRTVTKQSGTTDEGTTWKHLNTYSWDSSDSAIPCESHIEPPTIALPESFPQLVSAHTNMPVFTHYIQVFQATLDYILVSESHLETVSCGEMPSKELVTEHVAMPSECLPSDHVCLVSDLRWKGD